MGREVELLEHTGSEDRRVLERAALEPEAVPVGPQQGATWALSALHDGDVEPSLGEVGGAHQTVVAAAYDDDVDRHDWRARSTSPVEPRLGQAVRNLAALSGRASGMVRVLASAVMKLESPVQRGTT